MSRYILREGLKIPCREDPCLFREKKKRKVMERILEKAKRIWAPREKFSSLRGA